VLEGSVYFDNGEGEIEKSQNRDQIVRTFLDPKFDVPLHGALIKAHTSIECELPDIAREMAVREDLTCTISTKGYIQDILIRGFTTNYVLTHIYGTKVILLWPGTEDNNTFATDKYQQNDVGEVFMIKQFEKLQNLAIRILKPGDSVLMRPGTISAEISITHCCSIGAKIAILEELNTESLLNFTVLIDACLCGSANFETLSDLAIDECTLWKSVIEKVSNPESGASTEHVKLTSDLKKQITSFEEDIVPALIKTGK
jgi:hypothetical protein